MKFVFFRKLSLSRKLILGFMGAILMGTLLLMMPFSSSGEENLSFLTALFTITSAVCVTGLSVIDVGKELSTAGQIILLIFIQLGRSWYNDFFLIYSFACREKECNI